MRDLLNFLRYRPRMDILSDELARARAQGAVFSILRRVDPWGVRFEGGRPLTAHLLLEGRGRLEREGHEPVELGARDVVLATAGTPYVVVSRPGAPAIPIDEARQQGSDNSPGTASILLCGAYVLDGSVAASLLSGLPSLVVVPAADQDSSHTAAIDLPAAEVGRDVPGQQAILDRLLDLNLIYTLSSWWKRSGADAPGWYRALSHPELAHVLEDLHASPARDWTLDAMAQQAGMSRASFAAKFKDLVGQSPGRYLTTLRISRAEDALTRTNAPLSVIARNVGYGNEFAFATAFRRRHGTSPGQWRRRVTSAG